MNTCMPKAAPNGYPVCRYKYAAAAILQERRRPKNSNQLFNHGWYCSFISETSPLLLNARIKMLSPPTARFKSLSEEGCLYTWWLPTKIEEYCRSLARGRVLSFLLSFSMYMSSSVDQVVSPSA